MAWPWSTLARSPSIGAEAPDQGSGYGEELARLEMIR